MIFNKEFLYSLPVYDCTKLIDNIEKKHKIPNKLLEAISLTESGRTVGGKYVAWPWSLNILGESFFFENKNDLLITLKNKIKIQKNIDIGCMQINYKYHNKKFKNIEEILNPKNNIEWAALYLKQLFNKYNSWNKAIAKYHSSNPERMQKYLAKVHKNWKYVRQKKDKNEIKFKSYKISQKSFFVKNKDKIEFFKKQLMIE
tara:strand:+ start:1716 stop:2318 length:603 start_codon:yes stop_codon:yes gene_type:complete